MEPPSNIQLETTWSWPSGLPSDCELRSRVPGSFQEDEEDAVQQQQQQQPPPASKPTPTSYTFTPTPKSAQPASSSSSSKASKHNYSPRKCRICFEVVHPTFHPPSSANPFSTKPRVTYDSEDPSSGRLIRPCKCKGSSRYVHEACLQTWRHADKSYPARNYWQCPTCHFRYRLERLRWGRWLSSTMMQIGLTAAIFLLAMFALGFVADPIINFYVDPYGTLSSGGLGPRIEVLTDEEHGDIVLGWVEHFVKGLASLGLLSFVKVLFALSPWQWWNLRSSGILSGGGGRAGNTGRDRLASVSWVVIIVGITTFLYGVWKGVRVWSRRTLESASERVVDVPLDDDEDDEAEDDDPTPRPDL